LPSFSFFFRASLLLNSVVFFCYFLASHKNL
jgi:hypothetical protein